MPVCGSGAVVCSSSLLFSSHLGRCQAETPLILLCRFPGPALLAISGPPRHSNTLSTFGPKRKKAILLFNGREHFIALIVKTYSGFSSADQLYLGAKAGF